MAILTSLPMSGKLIISLIIFLFLLAVGLLFILKMKYQSLCDDVDLVYHDTSGKFPLENPAIETAIQRYKIGYYDSGSDVNTPAIVDSAMSAVLKGSSLMERFIKNVVALLITLGLLGTFIGLTMAVGDLATMFQNGNGQDVMATLENVEGGLMSSLSGMGVAFTTSLVGIATSILFTLLNIFISPLHKREQFVVSLEDYLDNVLAPKLKTSRPGDNEEILKMMDNALGRHSRTIADSLTDSSQMLQDTALWLNDVMKRFATTCDSFNENVRDFSEFNHNLRNNIERMDVNFIRLVDVMKDNSDRLDSRRDS